MTLYSSSTHLPTYLALLCWHGPQAKILMTNGNNGHFCLGPNVNAKTHL